MSTSTHPPARPWLPLASAALQASIDGDTPTAQARLQEIFNRFGPDAILAVLVAFVDTTCNAVFGRFTARGEVAVRWFQEGGDHTEGADEVSPAIRWAGRFAAARFADDETTAQALINSVQSAQEWSANVAAVLHVCGATIRNLARRPEVNGG